MSRWAASLVLLAACAAQPAVRRAPEAHAWTETELASAALGRKQKLRVLLPDGYATSEARYPVVYLLHGMWGDHTNFTKLTRLVALAREMPLIVVMPDADDSWYAKGYATWVATEVVDHVDATYRTRAERSGRAIAGISMGGYGAFRLALQHPDKFAFAGALSGAFDGPRGAEARFPKLKGALFAAFGPPGSPARTAGDVFTLLPKAGTLPTMFLACGSSDVWLPSTRALAALLRERNLPFAYHESPGGHDWAYWDAELPRLLDAAMGALAEGAPLAKTRRRPR